MISTIKGKTNLNCDKARKRAYHKYISLGYNFAKVTSSLATRLNIKYTKKFWYYYHSL